MIFMCKMPTHWFIKINKSINLFPRYCSCPNFIDIGTCKHHVAACFVMKHVDPLDREFLTIVGRDRPKGST